MVTARVYNGSTSPNWHSNGILSGYKSKEYGGSGYNQMVMDDATGQNRMQLYSTSANSQLHLGYLIAQNANSRGAYLGSGFDLKSDAYGAIRAGQGLYVSTHPKGATSPQLDVSEAHTQLSSAQNALDALSQASETHQAESLKDGQDALKDFADATQSTTQGAAASGGNTAGGGTGKANAFSEPVMLMASPSGLALSTQQSTHMAADEQINLVSGQSTYVATGKSLIASAAQKLSLFAQNAGMKLFAGKGKVEIQAQADNVEVTAQKSVKLISATENIEAAAKQEILLTSGGAYIRIKDGNIEIHAPGKIDVKGSSHALAGPAGTNFVMPHLPQGEATPRDLEFRLVDPYGRPSPGVEYKAALSDGTVKRGTLDTEGYTKISGVPAGTRAKVEYIRDTNPPTSEVGIKTDPDWSQFLAIDVTPSPLANETDSNRTA